MKEKQSAKQREKGKGLAHKFDVIKWILVILLFLLGFFANYHYTYYPLSLRIIGWLILAGVMLFVVARTAQGRRVWKFFREAQAEIKKVVWPTRQETFQTTLIVTGIVIVFSLVIWVVDMFLMWLVNWLTGQL